MNYTILTKQNYTCIELTKLLDLIYEDEENLVSEQIEIVNILEHEIYDRIKDIFEYINENYFEYDYGKNIEFKTIYNNIIICINNNNYFDKNYSYFILKYNKNNINKDDLDKIYDVFKFLVKK
jgi:hypothetical protein